MSKYIATVIRTGNSYALRVPKSYYDNFNLAVGQKIQVDQPIFDADKTFDPLLFQKAVKKLQELSAYSGIKDPANWQREIRKDRQLPGRE